jgi:hypothetical protein
LFVLNVHAPTENKIDYVNDSFYEQLERMFDKFPKYQTKMLLADFSAKVGKEDFSNGQLKMRIYMKLLMIMNLE